MESADLIWMDGDLVPWADAKVHVLSHTLHYGLSAFEGIRCYRCEDGRSAVFRLPEHIERLLQTLHILGVKSPFNESRIADACLETIRGNKLEECYIRPLVFLGSGEMGLAATSNPVHVVVSAWPWGSYLGEDGLANGIRVMTSSFQRFHINTLMTKAKTSGHYVNSILASREARNAGYDESLMLDVDGYAAEGCGENLFIARRGIVKTTPIATVLDGVTRDTAMTLLRETGMTIIEERFTRDEVYIADEAFFTGTAAEITPIRSLDDRVVGDGSPGPITKRLQAEYFEVTKGKRSDHLEWLTYV